MIRNKYTIKGCQEAQNLTSGKLRDAVTKLQPGDYTLHVRERVVKHKAHDMTKLHEYVIRSVRGNIIGYVSAISLRKAAEILCGSGFLFCAHKAGAGWKYKSVSGAEYWIRRAY